jgi:hypothetical protein
MGPNHRHPQPPEALHPPTSARNRLSGPRGPRRRHRRPPNDRRSPRRTAARPRFTQQRPWRPAAAREGCNAPSTRGITGQPHAGATLSQVPGGSPGVAWVLYRSGHDHKVN